MLQLLAPLLVASAYYSTTALLQNHLSFQAFSEKFSIKKIQYFRPVYNWNVLISAPVSHYFVDPFFGNYPYSQPTGYKENELVSGFV